MISHTAHVDPCAFSLQNLPSSLRTLFLVFVISLACKQHAYNVLTKLSMDLACVRICRPGILEIHKLFISLHLSWDFLYSQSHCGSLNRLNNTRMGRSGADNMNARCGPPIPFLLISSSSASVQKPVCARLS